MSKPEWNESPSATLTHGKSMVNSQRRSRQEKNFLDSTIDRMPACSLYL